MPRRRTSAEPKERSLPFRPCEVLEQEFVAIRGHSGTAPTWLLEPGHVDVARLLEWLRAPSQSASSAATIAICARLAAAGIAIPHEGTPDVSFERLVREALNVALLANELLYDHRLLPADSPAWQLADALGKHSPADRVRAERERIDEAIPPAGPAVAADPGRAASDEYTLLNRLLLEAISPPGAIVRVDTVRLNRLFTAIHGLRGASAVTSALCLSGGGIRSASFALGVLQALAQAGILEKFDYLSTVSGGGYIGSWLSTWIQRHPHGLAGVVTELGRHAQPEISHLTRKLRPEAGPIRFLRSYSHFLNPKAGLFSADTWSWIGIYVRNLTLNWLVIIPLLLLAILLPRLYAALLYNADFTLGTVFPVLVWIATLASMLTLICVTANRPSISDPTGPNRASSTSTTPTRVQRFVERYRRQGWILILGIAPLLVFAVLISLLIWNYRGKSPFDAALILHWLGTTPISQWPLVLSYIGVEHMVIWGECIVVVGWVVALILVPNRDWDKRFLELFVMLAAGLLTWALVGDIGAYAVRISRNADAAFTIGGLAIFPAHLYTVFAVPVVVSAVLLGMTVFIGGVSKFKWIEDEDREWWARFGAWVMIGMVVWAGLGAITLYGPPLLLAFPKLIAGVGGVSGLIAVVLGKSSLTAAGGQPAAAARTPGIAAMLGLNTLATAAIVFLGVFLAFLSLLTSALLGYVLHKVDASATGSLIDLLRPTQAFAHACGLGEPWPSWWQASVFGDGEAHLQILCQTPPVLIVAAVLTVAAVLVVASSTINLNKFSLHAAYRIRIVRTFLGASRRDDREPNPFTGFDPLDNLQMHELQPGLLRETDVRDLPRFVDRLRQALLEPGASSVTGWLVQRMCTLQHDLSHVLESRLRHAEPGKPVLKALQRSLFESLNRVLETARLEQGDPFRALMQGADRAKQRVALDQYAVHGSVIFANRLLLEAAFPEDIKPYDFPPPPPHKLIHVLNLTLNLVRGKSLAWQERKAAPFTVSPMHSGSYYLGYRSSRDYGGSPGISIGTAAAVSGAAVSPNMGYSSSPVLSLLLTLFNVRLGWWLGNPGISGNDTYSLAEPRFSLRPLLAEAFGMTDDQSPYIYLSDGGHFENLGLFEMVLRRCRLIVASDAGADPEYQFEDLGNAVRKIRVDLGIPIEFATMPIYKRSERDGDHGRYCALGRIRYSAIDGPDAPDGILVYLKPVVYGRESQDVLNYAARKTQFPQEPTLDQFFGEAQFESYRQLGEFEVQSVFGHAPAAADGKSWSVRLIQAAREHLGKLRWPP